MPNWPNARVWVTGPVTYTTPAELSDNTHPVRPNRCIIATIISAPAADQPIWTAVTGRNVSGTASKAANGG